MEAATAVAQQRPNLVSLLCVISLSHCHFRGVCILPGRQIPDGCKHSQFDQNYNQSLVTESASLSLASNRSDAQPHGPIVSRRSPAYIVPRICLFHIQSTRSNTGPSSAPLRTACRAWRGTAQRAGSSLSVDCPPPPNRSNRSNRTTTCETIPNRPRDGMIS